MTPNPVPLPLLDKQSAVPLSEQITHLLRDAIATHQYKPGQQLPSRERLAAHWQVSPMTVQQAVRQLIAAGLVVGLQGRGVFVYEEGEPARCGWPVGSGFCSALAGEVVRVRVQEKWGGVGRTQLLGVCIDHNPNLN